MSLNTVTLTWDLTNFLQDGELVRVTLAPSEVLTDTADGLVIDRTSSDVLSQGAGSMTGIIATDNTSIQPSGWTYVVTVTRPVDGRLIVPPTNILLNYADGATQDLSAVLQAAVGG